MVRRKCLAVNVIDRGFTSKLWIMAIQNPIHFYLVRHCRTFALGFFHQEQKRQHYQKHPSQKPKYVVIRQHGRLLFEHAPQSALGLMTSGNWVGTASHEGLSKSGQ